MGDDTRWQRFHCDHVNAQIRFFVTASHATCYGSQCIDCGQWRACKRATLKAEQIAQAVPRDNTLRQTIRQQHYEAWGVRYKQREQAERVAWSLRSAQQQQEESAASALRQKQRQEEILAWALRSEQQQQEESAAWWRNYKTYLLSPEWKAKRQMVFARDLFLCQICHFAGASQVHHLSYRRVGDEPLTDLISVCGPCHSTIHHKEQSQ